MSEHPRPAHASGYPHACAAHSDSHARPAYLYAAPAVSDRDAYATAYSDAHGDRNASPYAHPAPNSDAYASAYGNAHPSVRR